MYKFVGTKFGRTGRKVLVFIMCTYEVWQRRQKNVGMYKFVDTRLLEQVEKYWYVQVCMCDVWQNWQKNIGIYEGHPVNLRMLSRQYEMKV